MEVTMYDLQFWIETFFSIMSHKFSIVGIQFSMIDIFFAGLTLATTGLAVNRIFLFYVRSRR